MTFVSLADYIHDNCVGGQVERYNLFCSAVLLGATYAELNDTCTDMGGQLAWFDNPQEQLFLSFRLSMYQPTNFQSHVFTSECRLLHAIQ